MVTSGVSIKPTGSVYAGSAIDIRTKASERRTAVATYLLAFLLGLAITAYMFPLRVIFATDSLVHPVLGIDAGVHAVGQRYFIKDSWRWPPLVAKPLTAPEGTNVAFTDSIPLILVPMKLFRQFLPAGFHSIFLWLAFCWVAQPIAAVFALRSAGERRLLPNLAVALIASSMPTLLFRFGHSALCSHFLILIAVGLYFRVTRSPNIGTLIGAATLMLVALLINPYFMYMVIAVLVAAPLTLLIRRERTWIPAAGGILGGVAITGLIALLLGYGHALPMIGYGYYSMNLLSPIYPSLALMSRGFDETIDATGGQYEGYQYLGMGVILLVLVADFCLSPRERLPLLRRHSGLVLACVGLFLLALSTKVYAGHRLMLDLPAPDWILQLRATGRFFWPVAYVAVIVSALIVCRRLAAHWSVVVLLLLAALQYGETTPMRRQVRRAFKEHWDWVLDTAQLRPLLANHSKLMVWPKFACGGDQTSQAFSQLFLLASEVAIPVNTTYVGRFTVQPQCTLSEFPIVVQPGELWAFVPKATAGMVMSVVDWQSICRQLGPLVVCAQDLQSRTDLPRVTPPTLPTGQRLSTTANGAGDQSLASGWYEPEPWGVWSEGPAAELVANVAVPSNKELVFTAWAQALGARPSTTQRVAVSANGIPVATWNVRESDNSEYTAAIPPRSQPDQAIRIVFHIEHPITPRQDGLGPDDREVGLGLAAFRFDEQRAK